MSLKAATTPFKIPGSSINDFLDVDLSTAPLDGQVLKYTTAGGLNKWVAGTAGSASNIGLSDLSATAPLSYNNTTGVFSLSTANLLATPLTSLASGSGAVTATDTLFGAFGKLMAVPSDYVSKSSGATMTTGTIALSGTAMITVPTASGVTAAEVTNVTYVTNAIAANGAWSKGSGGSAGTINFSTGNVGIGTATPTAQMHIANAATEGTVYLNRPPSGATIFNEIIGPTGTVTAGGTVLAVRSSTSMGGGGSVFTAYASGGAGLRVAETGAIYMSNNVSMSGGPATIGIGGIGNTNTFSSGNSAAHTNTDFLFRAGAADRTAGNLFQISNYTAPVLTVLATSGSGNVGIGTTSTSQKLEINGNVGVPYNVGGAGQSGYSILSSAGGSAINRFGQNSATTIISNFESNGFSFNNTGGTLFRVDNNGKVGIGTTSPASLLDVQGTFDQQAVIGVSGQAGRINFRRGSDGALAGAIGYSSATDGGGMLLQSGGGAGVITLNAAGGAITFNSSNTYTATMLNGNLGVGTTNPTYSLSVSRNGGTAGQTAFFQDATPTTGATKLVVRAGAGQGTNSLQEWQNSAGTPEIRIGPYNGTNTIIESTNGFLTSYGSQTGLFSGSLRYLNNGTGVKFQFGTNGGATLTSGSMTEVGFGGNPFVPTSGTGVMNQLAITSTINQTGGANGTTRGIYIIPTLTSAADYRSIEIVPNQGYGIYQSGSSALNYFNGNVGIGTPSPSTLLHVNTATVGATVATFQSGTGSCTVIPNAGMSCSSDSRLKENVETIFNGLDKVLKLRGVTFQWKDRDTKDNSKHIGFIAQEVAKVAPELVKEDTRGYKQVNYANFVAVLTEAIKDLYHNHVVKIYDHLFTTEERVAQLEAENLAMKNYLCAKDMSAVFCKSFPPSFGGEK